MKIKEQFNKLTKSMLIKCGVALGFLATSLSAVAVTGVVKSWSTGETLKATDLNTTITSLVSAIDSIPNWTKNGNNAVYTAGNVGIGISPFARLHLYGSNSPELILLESTTGSTELQFNQKNTDFLQLGIEGNSAGQRMVGTIANSGYLGTYSNRSLTFHTNNQVRGIISASGNVGIGTTSPTQTLTVNGNAGNTTGVWVNNSDQRLKKNIEPLAPFLDRLLLLRPVTFEWKDPKKLGATDGKHIGFIAQEVEKVFPNWVDTDNEGFKWLNMEGANAVFVKALQELVERDRARDKRLGELLSENDLLKKRLDRMEFVLATLEQDSKEKLVRK